MSHTVKIDSLGARGDGFAQTQDGTVYVPYTLPGETVEVSGSGKRLTLERVIEPSEDRVAPTCRHFGTCGGCSLQHVSRDGYLQWKRGLVKDALRRAGLEFQPEPIIGCEPQTRRRAVFSARNLAQGQAFGFNASASHTIVDVAECPVMAAEITSRLAQLRELAALFGKTQRPFRMAVTSTRSGLDVDVSGLLAISDKLRRRAADFAVQNDFARISASGETIIEPDKPLVAFGETMVAPPPAGFLQATAEAEAIMADLVCGHLELSKRIIDLFSGCGTFSLRAARNSLVHAVESDAEALAALDTAFRFAAGLKTVTNEKRDLFRRPVTPLELKKYDGLIFDPPRAGAEEQARAIAKSDIRRVAAVSCNPTTLARDLAILVGGGYRLLSVTPIDQFLWSPHVEAVALLDKPRQRA